MELLSHYVTVFTDGFDRFIESLNTLFQHFISVGAREQALIVILIGGVLLIIMFMILFPGEASPSKRANAARKNSTRFGAIFGRKNNDADGNNAGHVLRQLAEIERDMLAIKDLYQTGHIDVEVYVSESRSLYEKAKTLS